MRRGSGGFRMAVALAGDFVRRRPLMVAGYGVLLLAQSVVQSVGLVLLIPLLAVVGIGAEDANTGAVAAPARFAFETLHLPESLPVLLVLFVTLMAVREVVGVVTRDIGAQLQLGYTAALRLRLFSAISRATWPFVAALRTSDTQHALQVEVGAVSATVAILLRSVNTLFAMLAYVVVAIVVAPVFAVPILLVAIAVVAVAFPLVNRSRAHGRTLLWAQRGAGAITYDHLEGMREAKSFGGEERAIRRFGDHLDQTIRSSLSFQRGQAAASATLNLGAAAVLALLTYGAVEGITGESLSPASLVVVIYLMSRLIPSAISLVQLAQQIAHTSASFESVTGLVQGAEAAQEQEPADDAGASIPLTDRLVVDGVRFRYTPDGPFVLDGVDLELRAGSVTQVTGATGIGKTTLVDVVLGLVEPEAGRVTVDGITVDRTTVGAWRRATAYVPQHTFLFHGTIRDNLLLADPEASDQQLWAALADAQIADRVRALPGGLDGSIGDAGHGLSGGERQRLALARALIRRPSLLVLDEATSALDDETEQRILEAVSALGPATTVVAITHRASAGAYAETIVHVDEDGLTISPGGRSRAASP